MNKDQSEGLDFNNCVYTKTKDGKTNIGGYTVDSIMNSYAPMFSNTNSDMDFSNTNSDMDFSNTNSDMDFSNTNSDIDTNKKMSKQKGGHFASIFKDLAVPAGLLYIQQNFNSKKNEKTFETLQDNITTIQESVYDKLLELVSPNERNKYNIKSRKKNKKSNKKTRSKSKN